MNHTILEPPSEADLDRLLHNISTASTARARRRTVTHRVTAIAGAAALVIGGTAGALVVAQASSTMMNTAECYAADDLASTHTTVAPATESGTVPSSAPSTKDQVSRGADMCAAVWRIGRFETYQPSSQDGKVFAVPQLVPCTLADGRVGFFPSEDPAGAVCAALGLSEPK